jgi:hypothetical protein
MISFDQKRKKRKLLLNISYEFESEDFLLNPSKNFFDENE